MDDNQLNSTVVVVVVASRLRVNCHVAGSNSLVGNATNQPRLGITGCIAPLCSCQKLSVAVAAWMLQ